MHTPADSSAQRTTLNLTSLIMKPAALKPLASALASASASACGRAIHMVRSGLVVRLAQEGK